MDDIYENMKEYNPIRNTKWSDKEHKMLIVFDDMIADIFINKKLQQIVEEVFIISKKLNFSLDFIA